MEELKGYMTVQEAAEVLGVSGARVRQLILSDRLPAMKLGTGRRGFWLIRPDDVDRLKDRPGRGRPRKSKAE